MSSFASGRGGDSHSPVRGNGGGGGGSGCSGEGVEWAAMVHALDTVVLILHKVSERAAQAAQLVYAARSAAAAAEQEHEQEQQQQQQQQQQEEEEEEEENDEGRRSNSGYGWRGGSGSGAAGAGAVRGGTIRLGIAATVKRRYLHWKLDEKLHACLGGIEKGGLRCGNNRAFLTMNLKGILRNMGSVVLEEGEEGTYEDGGGDSEEERVGDDGGGDGGRARSDEENAGGRQGEGSNRDADTGSERGSTEGKDALALDAARDARVKAAYDAKMRAKAQAAIYGEEEGEDKWANARARANSNSSNHSASSRNSSSLGSSWSSANVKKHDTSKWMPKANLGVRPPRPPSAHQQAKPKKQGLRIPESPI
jgi:ribosomal protein L12E/L44/L45/RPP1/RPP2